MALRNPDDAFSDLDISIPEVQGMHVTHGRIDMGKKLSEIQLRGSRVLVERIDQEITRGGIVKPETAKSRGGTVRGIVRAVGPGRPMSDAVRAEVIHAHASMNVAHDPKFQEAHRNIGHWNGVARTTALYHDPLTLQVGDEVLIQPFEGVDVTLETEVVVETVEEDPASPDYGKVIRTEKKTKDVTYLIFYEEQIVASFRKAPAGAGS